MIPIRFVTSNQGKLREAQARLGPLGFRVRPFRAHLEEIQADTLADVVRHKAASLAARAPTPYFVEDAGLFVDALHGFPGVYSRHAFDTIGCDGMLRLLRGIRAARRRAHFEAVIALAEKGGRLRLFSGRADGYIGASRRGENGFGFDPIFVPDGSRRTFAQLNAEEKGGVSHRGRALDRLAELLAGRPNKKV